MSKKYKGSYVPQGNGTILILEDLYTLEVLTIKETGITAKIGKSSRLKEGTIIGNKVTVAEGVSIGKSVSIGAHVSIGTGSKIDDSVSIGMQSRIGKNNKIGSKTVFENYVTTVNHVVIGKGCLLKSSTWIQNHVVIVDGLCVKALEQILPYASLSVQEPNAVISDVAVFSNSSNLITMYVLEHNGKKEFVYESAVCPPTRRESPYELSDKESDKLIGKLSLLHALSLNNNEEIKAHEVKVTEIKTLFQRIKEAGKKLC